MEQERLPEWESELIEQALTDAEKRRADEKERAQKRAVQLAREQGYHRLAVAIDRPAPKSRVGPGQLSLLPVDPTLFDQDAE